MSRHAKQNNIMGSVPIQGAQPIHDPFYRYTMPQIQLQYQKRNTTIISNMQNIANSLHRSPKEITKYMAIQLAVSGNFSNKEKVSVLKGIHSFQALKHILSQYIESHVLCQVCRLPETEYIVKNKIIYGDCKACSATLALDMDHPICRNILSSFQKESTKEHKKSRNQKKNKKKKAKVSNDHDEGEAMTLHESPETIGAVTASSSSSSNGDVAWESVADHEDDDMSALVQCVKKFRQFVRRKEGHVTSNEAVEELRNLQVSALLPSHCRLGILLRGGLGSKSVTKWHENILLLVPFLKPLLLNNKNNNSNASSCYSLERQLMADLEYICRDHPKRYPILILKLYEESLLGEESILEWATDLNAGVRVYPRDIVDNARRRKLRQETEPLICWLLEAESESESE